MRKAVEASNEELQITNGKVNKEITPPEGETRSSNTDGFSINGINVNSELKDGQMASADREENPDILDDCKNGSSLHLDKNIEKVRPYHLYLKSFAFTYQVKGSVHFALPHVNVK